MARVDIACLLGCSGVMAVSGADVKYLKLFRGYYAGS